MPESAQFSIHLPSIVHTPHIHHLSAPSLRHIFRQCLLRQRLESGFDNIHLIPRPRRSGRQVRDPCRARELEDEMLAAVAEAW